MENGIQRWGGLAHNPQTTQIKSEERKHPQISLITQIKKVAAACRCVGFRTFRT
jgi:hypothetical protein